MRAEPCRPPRRVPHRRPHDPRDRPSVRAPARVPARPHESPAGAGLSCDGRYSACRDLRSVRAGSFPFAKPLLQRASWRLAVRSERTRPNESGSHGSHASGRFLREQEIARRTYCSVRHVKFEGEESGSLPSLVCPLVCSVTSHPSTAVHSISIRSPGRARPVTPTIVCAGCSAPPVTRSMAAVIASYSVG
jgi:hypothetical protein